MGATVEFEDSQPIEKNQQNIQNLEDKVKIQKYFEFGTQCPARVISMVGMVCKMSYDCNFGLEYTIQIKLSMQTLPKNGEFVQRKRMFVEAPFHNMKSYVPLDWSTQDATTQQLQRPKMKKQQESESLKKNYNELVDKRLQRRYIGYVQPDLLKVKNEDTLTRELDIFNHSKVISGGSSRVKQETMDMGLQYQTLETIERPADNKIRVNNATQPTQTYQKQVPFKPSKEYEGNYEYQRGNPEINQRQNYGRSRSIRYEQNHPYKLQEQDRSYVPDRYRSLDIQRSPYPRQDLSKLVEQLYTGSKVQQYPFRNVMPDKLQNHLRQKTKADRKRAYQVTLNLFKN